VVKGHPKILFTAEAPSTQSSEKKMTQSQENPLVSVIIPCLNRETLVGQAIESALNQTYQNLEVIVVNDGSTDGTENVVLSYTEKTSRVRYFKHEVNKGIPAARNTGIRSSLGQYVAFLDSDDMWLPNKIEAQLQIFCQDAEEEVGVVWSNAYYTDQLGNTKTSDAEVPDDLAYLSGLNLLRRLFLRNFIIAGTTMIRRYCFEKVGLLDEQLRGGTDDWDLWLRLAPYFKFTYAPTPLAVIRLHDGNYTVIERHVQDALVIIEKTLARNPELITLKQKRVAYLHYALGLDYLDQGKTQMAREHLWKAISARPFIGRPLLAWMCACCGPLGIAGRKIYRHAKYRDAAA
jgi:glycosyltransferase involved in cell wall biosynthesis